jgi:hypothetical protein
MASSKELYIRSSSDDTLVSIITTLKSMDFEKLIVHARAEFSERFCPSSEQLTGANNFINVLLNLADEEAPEPEWVQSGLRHDFSIPERDKPPTDKK